MEMLREQFTKLRGSGIEGFELEEPIGAAKNMPTKERRIFARTIQAGT